MAKEEKKTEIKGDYDVSDVKSVLAEVNFHFWGEAADWLKKHGAEDEKLSKENAEKMSQDFQRLSEEGVEFTNNPEEAERLAKGNRG